MPSDFKHIVILTGAGISAESGLGTFRDTDGLWTKYDLDEVATPQGFARNPSFVHEFYNARRKNLLAAKPNAGHAALARLERESDASVLVVTQNVDNLHEQAGSQNIIHMHGELLKVRCHAARHVLAWDDDLTVETPCPQCQESGQESGQKSDRGTGSNLSDAVPGLGNLRPHVVWFGEFPMEMDRIAGALAACDLFLSIGTSGSVYPAAGFVEDVRSRGRAHTAELNLEPSEGQSLFAEKIYGPATDVVPAYVDKLLLAGG